VNEIFCYLLGDSRVLSCGLLPRAPAERKGDLGIKVVFAGVRQVIVVTVSDEIIEQASHLRTISKFARTRAVETK